MSPKDFRKISHLEPELKTNEVNGDERTDERTNTASPRDDPPGGSTENLLDPQNITQSRPKSTFFWHCTFFTL